jgi:hypothetical protein
MGNLACRIPYYRDMNLTVGKGGERKGKERKGEKMMMTCVQLDIRSSIKAEGKCFVSLYAKLRAITQQFIQSPSRASFQMASPASSSC